MVTMSQKALQRVKGHRDSAWDPSLRHIEEDNAPPQAGFSVTLALEDGMKLQKPFRGAKTSNTAELQPPFPPMMRGKASVLAKVASVPFCESLEN
jgi:hypothetical protein